MWALFGNISYFFTLFFKKRLWTSWEEQLIIWCLIKLLFISTAVNLILSDSGLSADIWSLRLLPWWNHGSPCELALTDRRERSLSGIMFVQFNWAFILPGISARARASERKPTDHEKRDGQRDDRSEVSSSRAGSALRRKLRAGLHMSTSEDALVREIKSER